MVRRLLALAVIVAAALMLLRVPGVDSQSAFHDGAFVLSQDGAPYVVSGGIAYPMSFTSDDTGVIPSLSAGATVSTVGELTAALAPAASPVSSPGPTQTMQPTAGTRDNPVSVGTPIMLTDGWRITVVSTIPNATVQVLALNRYNEPPAASHQFFIARVSAAYTGQGSAHFDGTYRLRAVGASAVSYSTFSDACGVYPDEISGAEVFSGGTITGNVCWSVLSSDLGTLVMYDQQASTALRTFLSLGR